MLRSFRLALAVTALAALAPATAAAQGDPSSFAPLAGAAACVQQVASAIPGVPSQPGSACADGHGLLNARDVTVSPDGGDVYAVAGGGRDAGSNAVVAFRRDGSTGALSPNGCISHDGGDGRVGSDGLCTDGDALQGAYAVTMSPDGSSVYVAASGSSSVDTFSRDAATGQLTQVGCQQTYRRGNGCQGAPAMDGVNDLAVSPDGRNVYATAGGDAALLSFTRDPETGELRFLGCVSDTGTDGSCVNGVALRGAHGVQVTPDGSAVYVTATMGAVTTYARDADTGGLTPTGCLLAGAPTGGTCTDTPLLASARSLTLSPDGAFAYVGGSGGTLTVLRRGASATELNQVSCLLNAPAAGSDSVVADDPGDDDSGDDDDDSGDDDDGDDEDENAAHQAGCAPAKSISSVADVTMSADGGALFAITDAGSVAAFRRDRDTGALTQTGCAESYQTYKSCSAAPSLSGGSGLAASADGRSVYVAGGSQVTALGAAVAVAAARPRLASHGRLTLRLTCPKARRGGCRGRVGVVHRGARARAYRLRAGSRRTLTVTVPARARRHGHGRRLRLRIRATDARHVVRATQRRVVLRR